LQPSQYLSTAGWEKVVVTKAWAAKGSVEEVEVEAVVAVEAR
jgi:hypothetical protein